MGDHPAGCGCTLSPEAFRERAKEWRSVMARALSRTTEVGVILARYPADEDLIARLEELIAAEGDCCTFLRFETRRDVAGFAVTMRYPPEFEPMLASLIA